MEVAGRDPALLDLTSVMIGGSHPPPAVLVDAYHLNLLPVGQLDSVVSGAGVIVRGSCVVPRGTWGLGGGGWGGKEGEVERGEGGREGGEEWRKKGGSQRRDCDVNTCTCVITEPIGLPPHQVSGQELVHQFPKQEWHF